MSEREPALLGDAPGEPAAAPSASRSDASASSASASSAAPDADKPDGRASPAKPAKRTRPATARPAPPKGAPVVHVAGFWRRLGAAMIDLAVILPVGLLLGWIATSIAGVSLPPSRMRSLDFWLDLVLDSDPALVTGAMMIVVAAVAYLLAFQALLGRTLGMRALGMRVIDVWGDRPSVARCAARTAGYLASVATAMLGFLWVGFDSEKRGLHDWIAGTYVIKA